MYEYLTGNKQWLLSQIDQERVWANIIGYSFKLGQKILNPLRTDKHVGSCSINWSNKSENLVLLDFADSRTNGFDCITAYQFLHPQKSWDEVCNDLLRIAQAMPTSAYKVVPGLVKQSEVDFVPIYRDWLESDIQWWNKRGVRLDQLERPDTLTLPVSGYIQKKEGKQSEVHFSELCYCYHHLDKFKFYFPNRKSWRFIGNMNKNDVWFLNRMSDILFICKSAKDLLVIENLCDFNLTMIQSETNYPSNDIFYEWECSHKKAYVLTDNDNAGRRISQEIKKQFLYIPCETIEVEPETNCKDIDEYYVKNGFTETFDYLNYLL